MTSKDIYILETANYDAYTKGSRTNSSGASSNRPAEWQSVSIDTLKENLSDFLEGMDSLFSDVENTIRNMDLKEITLNVSVSGKGKVGLIGTVEAGIEGGISIKLKRRKPND